MECLIWTLVVCSVEVTVHIGLRMIISTESSCYYVVNAT